MNKNLSTISASCIENTVCNVEVTSSACDLSSYIDITASAVNVLGEGPRSDPTTIGKNN